MPNKRCAVVLPLLGLFLTICACVWLLIGGPVGAQGSVQVTIQSMINAAPEGGTVVIPAGHFTESLTITKHITLSGAGKLDTVIHAPAEKRVIDLQGNHTLRLQGLALTGANISDVGGAVKLGSGRLEVINCHLFGNTAAYGGAVFQENNDGSVWIADSVIDNNHATNSGGAVFVRGDTIISVTSMFSNTAGVHGGAIHSDAPTITLTNSLLQLNQASLNGGGLNASNNVVINGGVIISNTAGAEGGGVLQWNGPTGYSVQVTGTLFRGNTAGQNGGGLWVAQGAATSLINTNFYTNTAQRFGGGVGLEGGRLSVSGGTFSGNVVTNTDDRDERGGGIYLTGVLTVTGAVIIHNRAAYGGSGSDYGGGIYANLSQPGIITGTLFEDNHAWDGGGLFSSNAPLLLEGDTFRSNGLLGGATTGYGGAVYANNNPLIVRDCEFTANSVVNEGGAMTVGGVTEISGSLFSNNQATAAGGGAVLAYGTLRIERSQFISNTSNSNLYGGGAVSSNKSTYISNTLFSGNLIASRSGSAVYLQPTTAGLQNIIVNCTIVAPVQRTGSAVAVLTGTLGVTNTIIARYDVGVDAQFSTLVVDHDLNYGGVLYQMAGSVVQPIANLTGDPLFALSGAGDYHLLPGSPAIDSGVSVALVNDLEGRPRPIGTGYDRGAYEWSLSCYIPVTLRN